MRTSPNLQQIRGAEPTQAAIQHKPNKSARVPKAVRHAIRLLVSGECAHIKAAAARAGISREWLSRCLAKDHIRVFAARETRQTIAAGQMRAAARLVDLVDAGSEHVSLDATKHLLGIGGIAPAPTTSVNVNVDIKAGYVIDLSETAPATLPQALPEIDLEATNADDTGIID